MLLLRCCVAVHQSSEKSPVKASVFSCHEVQSAHAHHRQQTKPQKSHLERRAFRCHICALCIERDEGYEPIALERMALAPMWMHAKIGMKLEKRRRVELRNAHGTKIKVADQRIVEVEFQSTSGSDCDNSSEQQQ